MRAYSNLVCDLVASEYVTCYHARLSGFGNIGYVRGENGIAVVGTPVTSKESDKSLEKHQTSVSIIIIAFKYGYVTWGSVSCNVE